MNIPPKKNYKLGQKRLYSLSILALAISIVTLPFYLLLLLTSNYFSWKWGTTDIEQFGQAGDFIGGVIGTFVGFATAGLLFITYRSQKKELKETRKIAQQQSETSSIQLFESTFFNMLKDQRSISANVHGKEDVMFRYYGDLVRTQYGMFKPDKNTQNTLENYSKAFSSNYQLEQVINELTNHYAFITEPKTENSYSHAKRILDQLIVFKNNGNDLIWSKIAYKRFYLQNYSKLSHYYRSLYHILKFISITEIKLLKSAKTPVMKNEIHNRFKGYADLLQAQLSSDELFLVFYNGICYDKFYALLNYYKFLENLPVNVLIEPNHTRYYPNIEFNPIDQEIDHSSDIINGTKII